MICHRLLPVKEEPCVLTVMNNCDFVDIMQNVVRDDELECT